MIFTSPAQFSIRRPTLFRASWRLFFISFIVGLDPVSGSEVFHEKQALFTVRPMTSLVFDGKVDPGKYAFAVNGFLAVEGSMKLAHSESLLGLARNEQYLLVGVSSPKGPAQNPEDRYELLLCSPAGEHARTIRWNSSGMIEGSRTIQLKNGLVKDRWSSEILIPLSELGALQGISEWRMALCRKYAGKRSPEGATLAKLDLCDIASFVRLQWEPDAPVMQILFDLKTLTDGSFQPAFRLPETPGLTSEIAITEFQAGINDAYNKPPEKIMVRETTPALSNQSFLLPPRGTLRMAVSRKDQVLFERAFDFDLREFTAFEISSALASKDHQFLIAEINMPRRAGDWICELLLLDEKQEARSSLSAAADGKLEMKLPIGDVTPGQYTLQASLKTARGDLLKQSEGPFAILPEKPQWWGNSLGLTMGTVPEPWTPVRIENENQVNVWGREYLLNPAGMPTRVIGVSGLMAGQFRFESKGKTFLPRNFSWQKRADDIVEFHSQAELDGHLLNLQGSIEFDGFFWLKCRFTADKDRPLPDVDFCYDIPADHAILSYTSEHMANNSGLINPEGWSKNLIGIPTFWIGNDQGGIYFCADDLRGWNLNSWKDTAMVAPVLNGQRQVRIRLLEESCNQQRQYEMEFGIQATPTRPMPKNWRSYQINGGINHNIRLYEDHITRLFNVPVPVMPYARNNISAWREKGVNALPYLAFLCVSPFTDEYRWFANSWNRPQAQGRPRFQPASYGEHVYICPQAPGFSDYYLDAINRMIDETDCNGLYFDYMQPTVYRCMGWWHGCGWYDNKKTARDSIRLRASRELAKRIYVLLKQKRPEGLVTFHNSGGICPPIHGFCDITWNGEQSAHQLLKEGLNYNHVFELDKYRVEQRHEPWGVVVCFLPQFLRSLQIWDPNRYGDYSKIGWKGMVDGFTKDPASHAATWHLAGLTLLHDSMFSGDWGMGGRLRDVRTLMAELGWNDTVEFHGYFRPGNPFRIVAPESSPVLLSSYKAANGFLLVAFNDTEEVQQVSIRLPDCVRSEQIKDGISGQTIAADQQIVRLSIAGKQPALLSIKQ